VVTAAPALDDRAGQSGVPSRAGQPHLVADPQPDRGRLGPGGADVRELSLVAGVHRGRASLVGPGVERDRVERPGAAEAGPDPDRPAVSRRPVTRRAEPFPGPLHLRRVGRHAPLPGTADPPRDRAPHPVVAVPRAGEGVRDLVQHGLGDLLRGVQADQVSGQADLLTVRAAHAGPGLGVVEHQPPAGESVPVHQPGRELPRLRVVQTPMLLVAPASRAR
jgi:hypothetical protein